jgi:phosphopantothenoylcysteine decarboxylase / phosphopantothenate---cysteine ligase
MSESKHIILGVTGSIAAVKSLSTAKALRDKGFKVRVAMTHSARQIVSPQAMRAVSETAPYVDMWWPDDEDGGERHVELAAWAQAILIAPATATCLGDLAIGSYDNCVTLVAGNLAPARWIFAPAMSQAMWDQTAVQENVKRLSSWGAKFIGPFAGSVASGSQGQRMAEPDEIANSVAQQWDSWVGNKSIDKK